MKPRWLFYHGHDLKLDDKETAKQGKEIFNYSAHAKATAFLDKLSRILLPNKNNKSDLASIPWWIQWLKGFEKWRYRMSAVLHDNIYQLGELWQYKGSVEEYINKPDPSKFEQVKFTRAEGDELQKEMMPAEAEAQNYTGIKAWFWEKYSKYVTSPAYWVAVRAAGWLNWKS